MATWSNLTDTTARLTLVGGDSGPFYRTKTLTGLEPDEQYTFYLSVAADTVAIEPVLEVVGGDVTLAEETGGETLVARGETNGSGEITIRFGVQSGQNGATSEGADDLDYVNQAAAEAAGWTVTDTLGVGSIVFDSGHGIAGSGLATSVLYLLNGTGGGNGLQLQKTFNVGAGASVLGKLWGEGHGSRWEFLSFRIQNTAGTVKTAKVDGNDGVVHMETLPVVAGGDGLITVTMFFSALPITHINHTYHFAGLELVGAGGGSVIDFSDIGPCVGTGTAETGGPEIAVAA